MPRIFDPEFRIVNPDVFDIYSSRKCVQLIAEQARICYQSDTSKGYEADCNLIRRCIRSKHLTPLEAYDITVELVTDRGISHELVRHRMASPQQESTRYCNYSKDKFGNEIGVIDMKEWLTNPRSIEIWWDQMCSAESAYLKLLEEGNPPEIARAVLPTCLKTSLRIKASVREWRHILALRVVGTTGKPHPQVQALLRGMLNELLLWCPCCFEDLVEEVHV